MKRCRRLSRSMRRGDVLRTLTGAMLACSSLFLGTVALLAQEGQIGVSVTVLSPAEDTQPAADGQTFPSSIPGTGPYNFVAIQRAGVVTASVRELTYPPTTVDESWLLLSVADERGTAAGWDLSLATNPASVLALLAGRADIIALVFPPNVEPRLGREVINRRYLGLIEAGSVPLLVALPGSGDGIWTQPLDFGFSDQAGGPYVGVVVLVLNLTFAP